MTLAEARDTQIFQNKNQGGQMTQRQGFRFYTTRVSVGVPTLQAAPKIENGGFNISVQARASVVIHN